MSSEQPRPPSGRIPPPLTRATEWRPTALSKAIAARARGRGWRHIISTSLYAAGPSVSLRGIDTRFRVFRLSIDALGAQAALRFNDDHGPHYEQRYVARDLLTVDGSHQAGQTRLVLPVPQMTPVGRPAALMVHVVKPGAHTRAQVLASVAALGTQPSAGAGQQFVAEWDGELLIHRIDVTAAAGSLPAGTAVRLEGIRV